MTLRKMGKATLKLAGETGSTGLGWGKKGVKLGKKGIKATRKKLKRKKK